MRIKNDFLMEKVWFIQVKNKTEGPYTIQQLRWDRRVTPDTMVWREGMKFWRPIRKVPELKQLFVDAQPEIAPPLPDEKNKQKKKINVGKEELTMEIELFPFWFWIVIILIMFYLIYKLLNP